MCIRDRSLADVRADIEATIDEAMDSADPEVGALRSPKAPRRRAVIFRSHGLLQICLLYTSRCV